MDSPRHDALLPADPAAPQPRGPAPDDLSAFAWVHDELRRSLESAHKALRRVVKEAEAQTGADLDDVDPAVLRGARSQLHQGVGALELVGLPAPALVLRASEAAVQRFVPKPHKLTAQVVDDIEHASFAVLDYLARRLAGKHVPSLALFPQYRAVQEAAGAERVHPADLWSLDWRWRELPADPHAVPRPTDAVSRGQLEGQLLALMRGTGGPQAVAARMSDLCAGLGAGAVDTSHATLWKLSAAVFEAQAHELLPFDVFSKRVASRLLAQHRSLERGDPQVSERLAQDLLFFCAQSASPGDGRKAPRLAAVRQAYDLVHQTPVDYAATALGRFDPALVVQAKKRVVAAKESWSAVAGGEMHRLGGLSEQFALVAESLRRLFPLGESFGSQLQQAVGQVQAGGVAPAAPLAMEVATSLLYVEAALEDADFDHPEQAERVHRLGDRLQAVRSGRPPEPLEGWMEELYRRVSDRQTMGSVVQELRASLSEAEKLIDRFFRDPSDHDVLIPVPHQLASMRGVLSVLGMDHASAALLRMRDELDGLTSTEIDPDRVAQAGVFDRLAGNLGALGFLIDMLSVQPQMAKSLFTYDAEAGILRPVMGRGEVHAPVGMASDETPPPADPRLIEQAQMLAFTSVREDVSLAAVARDLDLLSDEAEAGAQTGLAATVQRAREALERSQSPSELAAARTELSEALVDFVASASEPVGLDGGGAAAPASAPRRFEPPAKVTAPIALDFGAAELEDDDEMREIFLEEAREVLENAAAARAGLVTQDGDLGSLTTLRRAFHTLKGSARMVGLKDFGEAAWAGEQLYNTRLADQAPAGAPLLDFTAWALAYLGAWVDDIAERRPAAHDAATVRAAAASLDDAGGAAPAAQLPATAAQTPAPALEALRPDDETPPSAADAPTAGPSAAWPLGFPADMPSAADLDLTDLSLPAAVPERRAAHDEPAALPFDAFALDLEPADAMGAAHDRPRHDEVPFDASAQALLDPFDDAADAIDVDRVDVDASDGDATEPMPLGEVVDEPLSDADFDLLTLDLDLGADPAGAGVTAIEPAFTLPFALEATEATEATPVDSPELAATSEAAVDTSGAGPDSAVDRAEDAAVDGTVDDTTDAEPVDAPPEPVDVALPTAASDDDNFRQVGPLRIGIPLFNIYLNEADELSRRLATEAAEWAILLDRPIGETPIALAHSLAGSSATVGFTDLSQLARALEHAQARSRAIGHGTPEEARLFVDAAEEIRRLLHQFAAGFLKQPSPELLERLADHERSSALRLDAATAAADLPPETSQPADLTPELPLMTLAPFADDVAGEAEPTPEPPTADPPVAGDAAAIQASAPDAFEPVPADAAPSLPQPELRFDALGVAEMKPLGAMPVPVDTPRGVAADRGQPAAVDLDAEADDGIDAVDAVDAELFPIFEEEAEELLPQLAGQLRDWLRQPADATPPAACMRTLHTLKGGARLAGAMRLGELAHRLETRIERTLAEPPVTPAAVEALQNLGDGLSRTFDALRAGDAQAVATPTAAVAPIEAGAPVAADPASPAAGVVEPATGLDADADGEAAVAAPAAPPSAAAPADTGGIDWSRFAAAGDGRAALPERSQPASTSAVRVRAPLLDRLVNQAGEVSITRARIEASIGQIKGSIGDLTENLERLRGQLRDIEFQAETQMSSRMEAAKAAPQSFDSLEFDRFTRFQELTRMMAESVNDVATVQRTLQRSIESAEDELVAQARLTRDLQDDLLRTRMVEFEGLSDRLYRVVRQAAKETAKSVRLDIVGGAVEIDRGVLDRMTGSFEHLLRNCVGHGIEPPEARVAAGKDATGSIVVALSHEGNEVGVEFRDDGAGLDLAAIRAKGVALGLLDADASPSESELANLIFAPGFSTASVVTELAGRGVGMDVVRSEVSAMGGRIETATAAGRGTSFKLVLPLTTAVTQVVMLRCGETTVAVPSTLVEVVRRATPEEVEAAYTSGSFLVADRAVQFFWLGALLQTSARPVDGAGRARSVVVVRSAQQRIAVHVDEVLGNQEVVVKNLGPQLARLPGLAGVTLLTSGAVALIYNPVALATLHGDTARAATQAARQAPGGDNTGQAVREAQPASAPLVLVVDDSLTVRRVTQRLLVREGYRVALAKDGLDALERLAEELPQVVLSDIEMPRMDGFDLVRNMRADDRWQGLPVIMITSRIAQKHRDYAAELGVDHYLGKPYSEEDLLALVGRYTAAAAEMA